MLLFHEKPGIRRTFTKINDFDKKKITDFVKKNRRNIMIHRKYIKRRWYARLSSFRLKNHKKSPIPAKPLNQNQKLTPGMDSLGSITYNFRHLICYYSMKNLKIAELLQITKINRGIYIAKYYGGEMVLGKK